MKFLNSVLYTSTAALTLGVLSLGFAPTAQAASTYDATASLYLTFNSVSDVNGDAVTSGWDVTAFGSGLALLSESGDATASGSVNVVAPEVSLDPFSFITQSSASSGTATNGFASTDALTDLDITVSNNSGQDLTFNFTFEATVDAATSGTAIANASVDMLDELGFVDILEIAESLNGAYPATGFYRSDIEFVLEGGQSNLISGFVDTFGSAEAVVPVPAAAWLFGSGLLGLVGVARRKKA